MQTYNICLNHQLYIHYLSEWCHNYHHKLLVWKIQNILRLTFYHISRRFKIALARLSKKSYNIQRLKFCNHLMLNSIRIGNL